jgi:hypothetical protein
MRWRLPYHAFSCRGFLLSISSYLHFPFSLLRSFVAAQTFLLTESQGLDRAAEPVTVTASFYQEELADAGALRLTDHRGLVLPFQVTDFCEAPSAGPKTRASRHCRVHFLADLPAHGRRKYTLEIRPPVPPSSTRPSTDFQS